MGSHLEDWGPGISNYFFWLTDKSDSNNKRTLIIKKNSTVDGTTEGLLSIPRHLGDPEHFPKPVDSSWFFPFSL